MVVLYVLKVPEFLALAEVAKRNPACRVTDTHRGYLRIESREELVLSRKELGFKPAVWYGVLTAGFKGEIAEFGRDILRLTGV
jgi:hypothetical protein